MFLSIQRLCGALLYDCLLLCAGLLVALVVICSSVSGFVFWAGRSIVRFLGWGRK